MLLLHPSPSRDEHCHYFCNLSWNKARFPVSFFSQAMVLCSRGTVQIFWPSLFWSHYSLPSPPPPHVHASLWTQNSYNCRALDRQHCWLWSLGSIWWHLQQGAVAWRHRLIKMLTSFLQLLYLKLRLSNKHGHSRWQLLWALIVWSWADNCEAKVELGKQKRAWGVCGSQRNIKGSTACIVGCKRKSQDGKKKRKKKAEKRNVRYSLLSQIGRKILKCVKKGCKHRNNRKKNGMAIPKCLKTIILTFGFASRFLRL